MTSTTQPVRRKFARRLRALNWIEGCETDPPIVRKRKRINRAASIAIESVPVSRADLINQRNIDIQAGKEVEEGEKKA